MERSKTDMTRLIMALVLTVGIGLLGGLFTLPEINTWYAGLAKPGFNPPDWLFGPVWTVLYILMGISVYLIWKRPVSRERNAALAMFVIQFVLNFFWSILFFNRHLVGWALVEITVMWAFIFLTILWFFPLSKTAGWLMIPYLLWVSFAMVLNTAIWKLN